jgi:hypothetical protein
VAALSSVFFHSCTSRRCSSRRRRRRLLMHRQLRSRPAPVSYATRRTDTKVLPLGRTTGRHLRCRVWCASCVVRKVAAIASITCDDQNTNVAAKVTRLTPTYAAAQRLPRVRSAIPSFSNSSSIAFDRRTNTTM